MIKLRFPLLFLILICGISDCEISSVDYAVGEVKLISKIKTTVNGKPAINLAIKNDSVKQVFNVTVTVKAKRNQIDIAVELIEIEKLAVDETVRRVVIFQNLKDHNDYEFITYAVNFSRQKS